MFLLNGQRRHSVDVSDRGFQYGDGLFETIVVFNGKPLFLQRHFSRLALGCQRLLIPQPDFSLLEQEARQLASEAEQAVLKLIITRGSGGRGYRQPDEIHPTRLFSLHPFPIFAANFQTHGIRARLCHYRLAHNPVLAGIKHLNRLEQILARAEWQDDSIQEGILLDCHGQVVEGTMSNLFVVKDRVLYTSALKNCGVAGIVRQMVLEFAEQQSLAVRQEDFGVADVLQADELFVSNSVIGIWPVIELEQQDFGVGDITLALQRQLAAARVEEMSRCFVA